MPKKISTAVTALAMCLVLLACDAVIFSSRAHAGEPLAPERLPAFSKEDFLGLLESPPHVVRLGKGAEWQLWFFQPGTRSESVHGDLYIEGHKAIGDREGEIRECALGRFVWHGAIEGRNRLWDDSGWLPEAVDARALRNSEYLRVAGYAFFTGATPLLRKKQGDAVYVGWKLSKSAPVHGDLYVRDKWVYGAAKGERLKCALGIFEWAGFSPEAGGPFASGWIPVGRGAEEPARQ